MSFVTVRNKSPLSQPASVSDDHKVIAHYLLIYLMIAMGDSFLFDRALVHACSLIAPAVLFCVIANRDTQYVYPLIILCLGFLSMLFVRSTSNAMGPSEFLMWTAMICITVLAVAFDVANFLERLIRLSAVLVIISLIIYCISQFIPAIWSHISLFSFPLSFGDDCWFDSYAKVTTYYQAHGLILYVDRGFEADRNVGIFREPAVYQILLNSLVFVLLYMCPKVLEKRRNRLIALFVVAVLTTKSATGYLVTFFLIFSYALGLKSHKVSTIAPILFGLGLAFLLLVIFLEDSSWVAGTVFGRFISDDGFAIDASGAARFGAAKTSLELMVKYPLGCGYDLYSDALNIERTGYVAACLLKVAAVYGLPFGLAVLLWVLFPVFSKSKLPVSAKFSFIVMYLMATYFENEIFYTTLIFIPIYLYFVSVKSCQDKTNGE